MFPTALYQPNQDFLVWSSQHWGWLIYAAASTFFWIFWAKRARTEAEQQQIGWWMACIGLLGWAYSEVMMVAFGQFDLSSGLPLHLCYFLNFVLPIMVRSRSFEWFDWTYPIVMAGCLQALLTPDLKSGFPNFFNFKYWLVHIGLVQCALFCIFVYGFRPTFRGIFKCLFALNIYAAVVSVFNFLLDTNFLYLRQKPPNTILDNLGDGVWYILGLELMALVLFFLVWLPFGVLNFFSKNVKT